MPLYVEAPISSQRLTPEILCQRSFASFGTVIKNPAPSTIPHSSLQELPANAVSANQGSALKYLNITQMDDYYQEAPSEVPSKVVMNMFVCAPRPLLSPREHGEGHFPVEILERHPYTMQTFIPLGISPREPEKARYLVIVAPTLPPSSADTMLPAPRRDPGRGLPDLTKIRAFIADGSQAVTYAAGTWHAPMVVVGKRPIDFVVIQFANGVGIEDCQEVAFNREEGEKNHILVAVPPVAHSSSRL